MKTVKFYTLGCKVNAYETEAMKALFEKSGYSVTESDSADVFVINTCTVTAVGAKKSRQAIHKAKRNNPNATVAVVGCYSQVSPQEVRKLEEVDIILGTSDRNKIVDLVEEFDGFRIDKVNEKIEAHFEEMPSAHQDRTRAFLKIQDGCNRFCSYCIIPYARGPIRSRALQSAVNEAKLLGAKGFSEVVLTGIHLSSYGKDIGLSLFDPIYEISKIPEIKRIRLGSLEPLILTREFVDKISKIDKLCPSFHVSMQSGCDETLRRMNRKYTAKEYLEAIDRLKGAFKDCAVTTDVMVGFPGETEEEFKKSYDTVTKSAFANIHVFQYSKRQGTPAAAMEDQVPSAVKAIRSAQMIKLGEELKYNFINKYMGKTMEVLFERQQEEYFEGFTANYIKVMAKGRDLSNKYINTLITDYKDGVCFGEIVGGELC